MPSASPEILCFGDHSAANFQPILYCFIPNVKLTNEDSENKKTDCVNAIVSNLCQIRQQKNFWGYSVCYKTLIQ